MFGINTEAVRDAVDVIEVRNDLDGIVYGSVVPAGLAQSVNVCGSHRLRGPSELLSEFQQRGGRTVQPCGPPVAPDTIRNFMIDLCPEVVPVRVHSIVTLVRPRPNLPQLVYGCTPP